MASRPRRASRGRGCGGGHRRSCLVEWVEAAEHGAGTLIDQMDVGETLSANVDETPTPRKFSVEGESGFQDVHGHGDVRDDHGDRGGGEGAAAPVHGDGEAAGAEGGRWLHAPR